MQFTQRKIEGIDFKETEKVYESLQGHVVVTKQNGSMNIYKKQQEEFQNLKNYQHHQGQIMDVAFAPQNFLSYLVTVSYDRSLNIYNLDNLQDESMFRYQEEDSQIGYFSHVCFCSDNKNQLRFLVGTSNGYILDFNSDLNFNPSKHNIFENSITSMDVSSNGQIVASCVGFKTKLFNNFSFQTFIEFGEIFNEKNKINLLKFNQFNMSCSYDELVMVSDNTKVYLWKCDRDQMEVLKLNEWNIDQKCLDIQWQLGGFSANLILFNKTFQTLTLMRLSKSYDVDTQWNLDDINES